MYSRGFQNLLRLQAAISPRKPGSPFETYEGTKEGIGTDSQR